MKRSILSIILVGAISGLSTQAIAQYTGPTTELSTTVEKAKTMHDDTYIRLEGKIIQGLGREKYLFRDTTGEIVIEIDDHKWMGVTAGAEDTVVIYGEVDKDWNSIEIDVKRVEKQ